MQTHLITRHPIFNESLQTFAYEIRLSDVEVEQSDEEKNTDLFESLVAEKFIFIHYQDFTQDKIFENLSDKSKAVLIFSREDFVTSTNPLEQMKSANFSGFAINYEDDLPETINLNDFDYALINILDYDDQQLKKAIEVLDSHDLKIVAQRICSHAALKILQDLGVDYTQGGFLTCPNRKANPEQSQTGVLLFQLLKELQDPDVSLESVEKALVQDPRLVYKLLRVVNSAAFGLNRQIESIREAVVFIGLRQIRRWAVLLSLSNVEGKPSELMRTAIIRGHMCEAIGEQRGMEDTARLFTLGLLSTLDALFDQDMVSLLNNIALASEIKSALIERSGELGSLLADIIDYEDANWEALSNRDADLSLLMESYIWAISETEEQDMFNEAESA